MYWSLKIENGSLATICVITSFHEETEILEPTSTFGRVMGLEKPLEKTRHHFQVFLVAAITTIVNCIVTI